MRTCIPGWAGTVEIVDQVDAGGPVSALACAVVDVLLTVNVRPPWLASAMVTPGHIRARHRVHARAQHAQRALVSVYRGTMDQGKAHD